MRLVIICAIVYFMRIKDYAAKIGVHEKTALKYFHAGLIPDAYQLETGTIIIPNSDDTISKKRFKTVIYTRVSSSEQRKTNLEYQASRLEDFCYANGWQIHEVVKECGSGVNDERHKLIKLLKDDEVSRIVVEHKDRLTRFGFNYIQTLCDVVGIDLVVVNHTEDDVQELTEDLVAIITSFCARLYGKRRSHRKIEELTKALLEDNISAD